MNTMKRLRKMMFPILAVSIASLALSGCGESDDHPKKSDHPKKDSEHPTPEHPKSDHPK